MQKLAVQITCLGALVSLFGACGSTSDALVTRALSQSAALSDLPVFQKCIGQPWVGSKPQGFTHARNDRLSQNGEPHHNAQDVIANPGKSAEVGGWFSYGAWRRSLGDEDITLKVNDCNVWQTVASAVTDEQGVVRAKVTPTEVGLFTLVEEVQGDSSGVGLHLHVLPAGTHVVVFDIDGTLTTDNTQFIKQVLNPAYVPQAFPDAAAASHAWANKGYIIIYVTGRPFEAGHLTRQWLNSQKFATGSVRFTETDQELMSTNAGVGTYKLNYVKHLQSLGLVVDFAYGNETTDVFAYKGAGLTNAQIFMLGPKAGTDGTQPLPHGFTSNLAFIAQQADAAQPYAL